MYPAIHLFGDFYIPLYGVTFLIGFILMIFIARRMGPSYGIPKEDVLYAAVYAVIFLFLGAKLLYLLTKLPSILAKPDVFLELIKENFFAAVGYALGGLVFYGGLIGAIFGVWLYCHIYKMSYKSFMNLCAPLIPFVHGFGRIGCFLGGCCYGREYHGFGSVQFPYNEAIPELSEVPRVPVQLIEAGCNFIMSAVLFYLAKKKNMKNGQPLGIYLIYYSIIRFLMELLRGDVIRGHVGIFSTSQVISILLIPIGIWLVCGKSFSLRRKKIKKKIDRVE